MSENAISGGFPDVVYGYIIPITTINSDVN